MTRWMFSLMMMLSLGLFSQNMSLEACIIYTLENNIGLTNNKIRVDIAQERYRQAKRNILPTVETGVLGSQLLGRSIDPKTNAYVAEGSILSADMYLGTQINLFSGFKQQNAIRYQKLRYLMQQEDFRQAQVDLAFRVMNAYYDVVYYTRLENIAQEQVELTRLNLKSIQKQIDLGLKAESDLLEIQAQQSAEIHHQTLVKNQKISAQLNLKKMMNYPMDKPLEIVKSDLLSFSQALMSVDAIYSKALAQMPLVKKSAMQVKAEQKRLAIERGNLYPSLSFGANLSTSYSDSWTTPIHPNRPDLGFQTIPFKQQVSDNISKRLFLRLSIPVFSRWENRSAIKEAKLNLKIAQNQQQETERLLYQEITQDYQALSALIEEQHQLENQQKAMRKAYDIAQKKLEQGLIDVIAFYTAKQQLANSETHLLRTQLQRLIKEQTILFYLGEGQYYTLLKH